MNTEKYDPQFHVTARELREAGYHFDSNVSDVAWVPRGSVQFQRGATPHSPLVPVFSVPFVEPTTITEEG